VPRGRVILDGTSMAQNVPDIGSDGRFDGCLLAVHEYSMFGDSSWTTESQWINHFKGYVGSYSDRTVCTEWGGPMSPGSKNGVNYDSMDYNSSPTNYFEAYIRGISSQLRTWNMGSFYWAGLKDGDWYSMTTKSGSGSGITLSVANPSGLDRLQYAWGYLPGGDGGVGGSTGGAGTGGSTGSGGADAGSGTGRGGAGGGTGGAGTTSPAGTTGGNGGRGGASGTGGASGRGGGAGATTRAGGAGGGAVVTGGAIGAGGDAVATGGMASGSGGTAVGSGGVVATGGVTPTTGGTTSVVGGTSGGAGGTSPEKGNGGNSGSGGVGGGATTSGGSGGEIRPSTTDQARESGCSCAIARSSHGAGAGLALLLGIVALSTVRRALRAARRRRSGR